MPRDIEKEINDVIKNHPLADRHSLYQLKFFLINKEPTHQSKMWRCLRELKSRNDSIEAMSLELEDLEDSKLLLDLDLERLKTKSLGIEGIDKKEYEIRIRQIRRKKESIAKSMVGIHKRLQETKQEATFFLDNFYELEKIQPLKPFDSVEVQEEYWNERLSEELKLKLLVKRPLDTELIKTILSLRDSSPIKQEMINIFGQMNEKVKVQQTINEHDKLVEQAIKAESKDKTYKQWVNKECQ